VKILSKVISIVIALSASSSFADWGRVCFYEHANYAGRSFCMNPGEQNANLNGFFNDMISSISIDGNIGVAVYTDANYSGAGMTINQNIPNLNDVAGWNDRISSIAVDYDRGGRPDPYPGRPGRPGPRPPGPIRPDPRPPRGGQVCFYEDSNFRGQSFCMRSGETIYNLNGPWNDRISSMQVFGYVEVSLFADSDFRRPMGTFNQSIYNFADGIGNDMVSSIQVR
jgi:hypothetical protein